MTIQFLFSFRTCNESLMLVLQSENPAKVKMTVVQLEKNAGSQVQNCTPISPPCWSLSCCSPPCQTLPLYRYTGSPDCHGRGTRCPAHTCSHWFRFLNEPVFLNLLRCCSQRCLRTHFCTDHCPKIFTTDGNTHETRPVSNQSCPEIQS